MDELFRCWAKHEPNRCRKYDLGWEVFARGYWHQLMYAMNAPQNVVFRQGHLFIALCEAIEAREWGVHIQSVPNDLYDLSSGFFYEVTVASGDMQVQTSVDHALLNAYVDALEAESP